MRHPGRWWRRHHRELDVRIDTTRARTTMNFEEKISPVGNLVVVLEDVEYGLDGKSHPVSFEGFATNVFSKGPKKGDSDHRVGVLRIKAMDLDQMGGADDAEDIGVVRGLTNDFVKRLKPIGNSERERGRVLAGEFNGEDSGVFTLLKEATLSVGHTVDKDKETGEEHVGNTDVKT